MIDYRIAAEQDREDIIDFINMVFSMLRVPHNFETLLPKAYSKELGRADIHVMAQEEGRICGCLGMYVFPLRVADETLKVGYLGSMSVHPRLRGKGTMGELMRRQIARGREMGLDMLVLGGQRQRYQYSGFETVGTAYVYSISRSNVRHAFADVDCSGMTYRPMEKKDVEYAFDLYDQQIVAGARTRENFIASLSSYRNGAWMIERHGVPVGYLSAAADKKHICELVMAQDADIPAAIKAWISSNDLGAVRITAAPYDLALNKRLSGVCEGVSITPNCMLRVLNHKRVLATYMKLKNRYEPLRHGRAVIKWENEGSFAITVDSLGINVDIAPEGEEETRELSNVEALQLFFGCNRFAAPEIRREMPGNWFPLPFHIAEPDSF